jgi:hypothetical protein
MSGSGCDRRPGSFRLLRGLRQLTTSKVLSGSGDSLLVTGNSAPQREDAENLVGKDGALANRWIPKTAIVHPNYHERFAANHPQVRPLCGNSACTDLYEGIGWPIHLPRLWSGLRVRGGDAPYLILS